MDDGNEGLVPLEEALALARVLERGDDHPDLQGVRRLTGVPDDLLYSEFRLHIPEDWVADEVFTALSQLGSLLENTSQLGPALEEHPALFRSVIDLSALIEMQLVRREAEVEEDYARAELKIREIKPRATIGEVQSTALLDYPAISRKRLQTKVLRVLVEHLGKMKSLAHAREATLARRSDRELEDQRDNKKAR